jgi:hypothetical protein
MFLSARVAFRWRTPVAHWASTVMDHPRSAGAHARLALLLLEEAVSDVRPDDDRLAQAEEATDRALQINDHLPEAWHARGLLAVLRGDCGTLSSALERARALRPGDPELEKLVSRAAARCGAR